jgi:cellulose synthase/poly-beta-1,6-N-acetylglucosamine synthase-like glycosyltransferase
VLPIRYFFKPNSGPGPSRNFGFARARGAYFVIFDSDCILPPGYFEAVGAALDRDPLDAWGGPDQGHERFTLRQRAMAYTMSSFLTTGGIRGGRRRMGWFQPRSFNMGISRQVFEATGGFHFDRFAEDIEFSTRMRKAGFRVGLIPDAFVFHKRRSTFAEFFRQVFYFGKGRAQVGAAHPGEVKATHWFPALFTLATLSLPVLYFVAFPLFVLGTGLFAVYLSLNFFHSLLVHRHPGIAALSVISALLQLWGYGLGFLTEKVRRAASPAVARL